MSSFFKGNSKNHFLVSAPRSGSTWLQTMFNAHPKLACVERRLFGNYADLVLDDGIKTPRLRVTLDKYIQSLLLHHGYPQKEHEKLTNIFIDSLLKAEQNELGRCVVVDKITPYVHTSQQVAEQIQTYFPKSKIIYLVRDGRDVLTSGIFHWFNKQLANETLSDFEKKRRAYFIHGEGERPKRFFQDHEIEQWVNEWQQPLQTIESVQKSHKIKLIDYETMLEDPQTVLQECFHFLKLNSSERLLEKCLNAGNFKTMSHGRERGEAKANAHVRKGVSGDWKNYFTYQDAKLFHEIAGEELIKYGYVASNNWYEELR